MWGGEGGTKARKYPPYTGRYGMNHLGGWVGIQGAVEQGCIVIFDPLGGCFPGVSLHLVFKVQA